MHTATTPLDHAHIEARDLHDRIVDASSADHDRLRTGINDGGMHASALAAGLRKALRTQGAAARSHLQSAIAFLDAVAGYAQDAAHATGSDVRPHTSRMIAASRAATVELGRARSAGT